MCDQYVYGVLVPSEIHWKTSVVCSSLPMIVAQTHAHKCRFFCHWCTIRTTQNVCDHAISHFNEGASHTTRNVADGLSHQLPYKEASRDPRALPQWFIEPLALLFTSE